MGDVNADGVTGVVTVTGPGAAPPVQVFDVGGGERQTFFAYSPMFAGRAPRWGGGAGRAARRSSAASRRMGGIRRSVR
jgi:hypothetical protein